VSCERGTSTNRIQKSISAVVSDATSIAAAARTPLGWSVEAAPDLRLGGEDAPPAAQFHAIAGLRQLSDGRIVLLDGGSRELRFFDAEGRYLGNAGRHGAGPAEFEAPMLVRTLSYDSLLVYDTRRARFHIFANDGLGFRVVRPTSWRRGRVLGAVGSRVLLEHATFPVPTPGVLEEPFVYAWRNLDGNEEV